MKITKMELKDYYGRRTTPWVRILFLVAVALIGLLLVFGAA